MLRFLTKQLGKLQILILLLSWTKPGSFQWTPHSKESWDWLLEFPVIQRCNLQLLKTQLRHSYTWAEALLQHLTMFTHHFVHSSCKTLDKTFLSWGCFLKQARYLLCDYSSCNQEMLSGVCPVLSNRHTDTNSQAHSSSRYVFTDTHLTSTRPKILHNCIFYYFQADIRHCYNFMQIMER